MVRSSTLSKKSRSVISSVSSYAVGFLLKKLTVFSDLGVDILRGLVCCLDFLEKDEDKIGAGRVVDVVLEVGLTR